MWANILLLRNMYGGACTPSSRAGRQGCENTQLTMGGQGALPNTGQLQEPEEKNVATTFYIERKDTKHFGLM